jgi:hypothetical protein
MITLIDFKKTTTAHGTHRLRQVDTRQSILQADLMDPSAFQDGTLVDGTPTQCRNIGRDNALHSAFLYEDLILR